MRYKKQDEDRLIQHRFIVRDRNGVIQKNIIEVDPDTRDGQPNCKRLVLTDPVIIDDAFIPFVTVEIDGVVNPPSDQLDIIRQTLKANVPQQERAGLVNEILKQRREAETEQQPRP